MDGHVATASTGSQQRRGTSGPALPVPRFPLLVSPARRRGRGRDTPRRGRAPAPAPHMNPVPCAIHERTGATPSRARAPQPGHGSPSDSVPAPGVELPPPSTGRSHAAASPQGSRGAEATARAPWHPGPAATVTLSRAPLSLRPLGAAGPGASPPWGGDGGPARDSGRRHPRPPGQVLGSDSG